jgi:hypothetical protein
MKQLTQSAEITVERRRLGFYIVAAGKRLFTIDFGRNSVTMDSRYRVTWGANFEDFPSFDTALGFCRDAGRSKRKAR